MLNRLFGLFDLCLGTKRDDILILGWCLDLEPIRQEVLHITLWLCGGPRLGILGLGIGIEPIKHAILEAGGGRRLDFGDDGR